MPDASNGEQSVLNRSPIAISQPDQEDLPPSSRRASSTLSLRSRRLSPTFSAGSKTPLTPEESPTSGNRRKRSAGVAEQEDQAIDSSDLSPSHTRTSSGESAVHLCICQPEPKPPRPRNAFILYRQHHQGSVVARNPGLSNPDISKIIGEQWQNEKEEHKSKWKALAEEEKARHQQQYPGYRYQPKRAGRRGSVDATASASENKICQKCGGRTILTPSALAFTYPNLSSPSTPASTLTPLTRTLPAFGNLSLDPRANIRPFAPLPPLHDMAPNPREMTEERDDIGPLSPDGKRRRYNNDARQNPRLVSVQQYIGHPPGSAGGPGTPFPPGLVAHQPVPPGLVQIRRESLPGIQGVAGPGGAMAPPPKPGMGYQQHRVSQGHLPQDRTLTLPPLQTGRAGSIGAAPPSAKGVNLSFRYKVKVLSQVAPPALKTKESRRGPLIAIEGDDPATVKDVAAWLKENLAKGENLAVTLLDGPAITVGERHETMANFHLHAADWLKRSKEIIAMLAIPSTTVHSKETAMIDAPPNTAAAQQSRKIDEDYNDSDDDAGNSATDGRPDPAALSASDRMDVDKAQRSSMASSAAAASRPVVVIPNYSLYTCNRLASSIPIAETESYEPHEHWQWTATLWRGVVGPDLTIYVRDVAAGVSTGPSVEIECVEHRPDIGLVVVKRTRDDHRTETDASVLRRLGFEVGEWVREFVAGKE